MCWHYSHAKGIHVKGANLLDLFGNKKKSDKFDKIVQN